MNDNESCYSCRVTALGAAAPLWERIYVDDAWRVAHAYNSALPGWLVIIAARHIESLDELTEHEAIVLGKLTRALAIALKAVVGAAKCYVICFAEQAEHTHTHIHIVPRAPDMPADRRGTDVFMYLKQPSAQWISEDARDHIARRVQAVLASQV